jgi:hypothetical protein
MKRKFIPILIILCFVLCGCLPDVTYFDDSLSSSNVSSVNGTAPYIPYFRTSTQLSNTRLYWDNTNSRLGLNNNAPANELDVTGQVHATGNINTDSNVYASGNLTLSGAYLKSNTISARDLTVVTGSQKTLVLDTPVWEDMVVSMTNVKAPAADPPTWRAYLQSEVPAFSKDAVNVLYFSAQLPHSYKEGSDLEFHVHLSYPDATSGNSTWYLSYSWANINANFPAASSVTLNYVAAPGVADRHQMVTIAPTISGVGKTISSVILCSIQRLGNVLADNYNNEIYLVSGDFHYQVDTMGSRQQVIK